MRRGELLDRFASLLFPQGCVLCGEVVEYDSLWCGRCPLPALEGELCLRCGKRLADCACGRVEWAFERAVSPFLYAEGARRAVLCLKTKPDRRTAAFLTSGMRAAFLREYGELAFDCVVEVPVNPERFRECGFNQAELLAAEFCALLRLPFERRALLRRPGSKPQHTLSAEARFANAAASYGIARPGAIRGRRVLLIDDVFTSGATSHICAKLLRHSGALSVHVLTAASTPRAPHAS